MHPWRYCDIYPVPCQDLIGVTSVPYVCPCRSPGGGTERPETWLFCDGGSSQVDY